jgi:Ran GTPase-activating protein (RanGAP) involved in mRNA processing and transport
MSCLRGNQVLQLLSMRHNKLGNSTALALGDMLLRNTALKKLVLSWNAMGPSAGALVAKGILYNSTLEVSFAC